MTLFLDCGGDNDCSLSARPRSKVLLARLRTMSSDNCESAMSLALEFAIGATNPLAVAGVITAFGNRTLSPGGGGSTMPCGLVLPAARANVAEAD